MDVSFIFLRFTFPNYSYTVNSFRGSTLQVTVFVSAADGEWAIVGGTGKLSMARGTVNFTTAQNSPNIESYKKKTNVSF